MQKLKIGANKSLRPTPFFFTSVLSELWLLKNIISTVEIGIIAHHIFVDVWTWYLIYDGY